MAKLVKYIFIPILFVFLMSHNASAASKTFYLKHGIYAYGIPATTGSQGGSSPTLSSGQTYNMQNNVYGLDGSKIWYSMAFRFNAEHTNVSLSDYTDFTFTMTYCSDDAYFAPSSHDYFRITDYYEFAADSRSVITGTNTSIPYAYKAEDYERCRNVLLRGKNGAKNTDSFQLGTTNNGSFTRIFGREPYGNDLSYRNLIIISPTVVFYNEPNEADEAIQKEKQNVQNAADDSETAGGSSSSSSQQGTSSLISTIGSAVSVITSASPTNCLLNGNMGNLDVGQIDLCSNPVPTFVQIIGSIILILMVVPLCITLFNRFIGLFRSFQS